MSQKLKVVTIGGGSSYTPELLEGFLKRYHELPISELWLVDVAEGQEKLDIIHALCQRMVEKAGVPMKVYKTLGSPRGAGRRRFRHHPAARWPA